MGGTPVSGDAIYDCTLMEGTFILDRYGTTVHIYYDDTLFVSYDSAFTDASQIWFDVYGSFQCPPTTVDYDDVFVRKYTSPEPTTSVGAEELIAEIEVEIDRMKIKFDPTPNQDKIKIFEATFQLEEGASYDLDADDVRVIIDGVVEVTIPAGSFERKPNKEKYVFRSAEGVEPEIIMKLDFETGEWMLKVLGIDASAVDNCDGVTVALAIGDMSGEDSLSMWVGSLEYPAGP